MTSEKNKFAIFFITLFLIGSLFILGTLFPKERATLGSKETAAVALSSGSQTIDLSYGRSIPELNISQFTGAKDVGITRESPNAGYYQRGAADQINYRFQNIGLYWFDLSVIPKGAVISDARLILSSIPVGVDNFNEPGAVPIYLVKTVAPNDNIVWSEGSGLDFYDQYKGTSWLAKDNLSGNKPRYPWSGIGSGDLASAYSSSPVGNMNFVKNYGIQQSDNLASIVSDIINNGNKYEGFSLDRTFLTGDLGRQDSVATKEYADSSKRPTLRITYSLPVTVGASTTEEVVPPSTDTTPPAVPTGLSSSNITSSSATLTWTAVSTSDLAGYRLYRNGTKIADLGKVTSYTVTGLTPATTYSFQLSAVDTSGNESVKSVILTVVTSPAQINQTSLGFDYNVTKYTYGNTGNLPVIPVTGNQPAKNSCYYDPAYKLSVCRVTDAVKDVSGESFGVRPVYSRWRIDNSNGQYILLAAGTGDYSHVIYRRSDNTVYKKITEFTNGEWNELRWDYSGLYPNRIYYVSACSFFQYDIVSGQSQLIRNFANDFPGCAKLFNDVEGDSSGDSRYWTWMTTWDYDGRTFPLQSIITYDKQEDKIINILDASKYSQLGGKYSYKDAKGHAYFPRPNMVDTSPSGDKIALLYGRAWGAYGTPTNWGIFSGNIYSTSVTTGGNGLGSVFESTTGLSYVGGSDWGTSAISQYVKGPGTYYYDKSNNVLYVWSKDGTSPAKTSVSWEYGNRPKDIGTIFDGVYSFNKDFTSPVKICVDETHSGWAYDYQGNEVWVCQNNRTDWITYTDVKTGQSNNLIYHGDMGWNGGWHFGRVYNSAFKGWIPFSMDSTSFDSWGYNQLLMMELKPYTEHPRIWRLGSTHNNYAGIYYREVFAPLSSDGKTIWWQAVWLNAPSSIIETYKIDLPVDWYQNITSLPTSFNVWGEFKKLLLGSSLFTNLFFKK